MTRCSSVSASPTRSTCTRPRASRPTAPLPSCRTRRVTSPTSGLFNVTVTRVRDDIRLFTDDRDKLTAAIERNEGNKTSALETVGELSIDPGKHGNVGDRPRQGQRRRWPSTRLRPQTSTADRRSWVVPVRLAISRRASLICVTTPRSISPAVACRTVEPKDAGTSLTRKRTSDWSYDHPRKADLGAGPRRQALAPMRPRTHTIAQCSADARQQHAVAWGADVLSFCAVFAVLIAVVRPIARMKMGHASAVPAIGVFRDSRRLPQPSAA